MFQFKCLDCQYVTISTLSCQAHEADTGHFMQGVTKTDEDIEVRFGPGTDQGRRNTSEDGLGL
jgi:hypothetical protein